MPGRSKLAGAATLAALVVSLGACTAGSGSPAASARSVAGSIGELPIDMTFDQAVPFFEYDQSRPLDIKDAVPAQTTDGISVREISYDAGSDRRGVAYLVVPAGDGPFAACLFLHAEGAGGMSKGEFLDEAVGLAKKGVVSLLPSRYFPAAATPVDWQEDRQKVVDQVVELRRGIDVLIAQKGVDASRIGYVGHDYGAMSGAIAAAVDNRIKAEVLMSMSWRWGDWFFLNYAIADQASYLSGMKGIDPVTVLGRLSPATLFLQYGAEDGFNPPETRTAVAAVQPQAKLTSYPNTAWSIDCPEARADRLAWLVQHLAL
jgi:hypothetical protein